MTPRRGPASAAACSSERSSEEDVHMGSSSGSDAGSSSAGSSACSSQSTSPVKLEPSRPAAPRFSLNLGGLPRSGEDSGPSSSRAGSAGRPGVPRLGLRPSPLGEPPLTAWGQPATTTTLSVDLLSPAFAVGAAASGDAAAARCAERLGVAPDSLRYYALMGAPSLAELPPGCTRVAVEVSGSRFSLEAVEGLLRENKELAAAAAVAAPGETAAGDQEQRLLKEQVAVSKQMAKAAQARVAKLEGALQKDQAASKELSQEVALLRRQLKRSEELRQRGQRALDELKQEFEALQRELVFDGAVPGGFGSPAAKQHMTPAPANLAASPMMSTPGGPASAAAGQPDRLAELLGRLCEATTLEKLEALVNKLQT